VGPTSVNAAPNPAARDTLIAAILAFIGRGDLLSFDDVRAALEREIDAAGAGALVDLQARLAADEGWAYYPPDPLARRIHHLLADRFLDPASEVIGLEHLHAAGAAPLALFANHLSYADANAIEVLLRRAGGDAVAGRLTAIAGPKVFTSRERRFSSLCFGTIKVPQSAEVASGEAQLHTRDVARAARQAIDVALGRIAGGDALLLFGEGTRSRGATLQPMLPGVARYLQAPGTWIVPIGLTGSERLFPVDSPSVHPSRIVVRIGVPVASDALREHARGDRRVIMDAIGLAIASLLPPSYRGVYADAAGFHEAKRVLDAAGAVGGLSPPGSPGA
jgi:1-acyl-sn-glycerol-3-phosphate acyltransferase